MKFNDALSRVAWQDFEVLVANHYRDEGYDVAHCGDGQFGFRDSSDVDLRMRKDGKLTLVHCRHESVSRIDAGAVERLIALGAEDDAAEVIVISSADIPEAARAAGEAGGATLIDGVAVRRMLGELLADLHPTRSIPGVDAQHGEAHVVIAWPARGKRRTRWAIALIAVALLALLASYAPALKRLLVPGPPPPPATAKPSEGSSTVEVPLPAPPPAN